MKLIHTKVYVDERCLDYYYIVSMKVLLLVLGLILFGFITALQYKHLWKDIPELFKDLKKKKEK